MQIQKTNCQTANYSQNMKAKYPPAFGTYYYLSKKIYEPAKKGEYLKIIYWAKTSEEAERIYKEHVIPAIFNHNTNSANHAINEDTITITSKDVLCEDLPNILKAWQNKENRDAQKKLKEISCQ